MRNDIASNESGRIAIGLKPISVSSVTQILAEAKTALLHQSTELYCPRHTWSKLSSWEQFSGVVCSSAVKMF